MPTKTRANTNVGDSLSTKNKILDQALRLFSEAGYAGTSIRQLARAVGLRESSIYNHFSGKEDIYRSLVSQWGAAAFVERLQSEEYRTLSNDLEGFCRQCGADLIERWLDKREQMFSAMVSAENKEFYDIRVAMHKLLFKKENDLLAQYFKGFAKAGVLKPLDVNEVARIFSSGLICLRRAHIDGPEGPVTKKTLQKAMNRYLECFLDMVQA